MKSLLNQKSIERGIFIILIVFLALYGMKDSDAAEKLIRALTDAFTLLFTTIDT